MLLILAKGLLVGLVIAAPVGPIAIVCISHALMDGRVAGLVTGLGAASADAVYGAVAGFGLSAISLQMTEHAIWLRVGGGVVLCALGLKALIFPPRVPSLKNTIPKTPPAHGLLVNYTTTFFLTLANPVTIAVAAALFASMSTAEVARSYGNAGMLVLGVFLGSGVWWLFLSFSAGWVRNWLNPVALTRISRVVGVAILLFGVLVLMFRPGI
ncbi:MAG TPA: LysE family transporter [bacterium]|nr:LysE family transporter [bacterium]